MAGDTILFRKGSTFNMGGQLFGQNEVPFDYSLATLEIYETHNIKMSAIEALPDVPAQGTFFVSINDEESLKLPQGRMSWFKLRLVYTTPVQAIAMPPIWVQVE